MRRLPVILALLVAAPGAGAQQPVRYVTDSLKLETRSGPGLDNRILRMLESGTPLEVLEDSEGWSRVRLPDGEEAWILTRFLMDEPPARGRLQQASDELASARQEIARLETRLSELRGLNEDLQESNNGLESTAQEIAAELAELKRTAAGAVAMRDENLGLRARAEQLEQRVEILQQDYVALRHGRSRDWFLAGAGVLLGGMLLGIIIPRIRWRRRRSWSEL